MTTSDRTIPPDRGPARARFRTIPREHQPDRLTFNRPETCRKRTAKAGFGTRLVRSPCAAWCWAGTSPQSACKAPARRGHARAHRRTDPLRFRFRVHTGPAPLRFRVRAGSNPVPGRLGFVRLALRCVAGSGSGSAPCACSGQCFCAGKVPAKGVQSAGRHRPSPRRTVRARVSCWGAAAGSARARVARVRVWFRFLGAALPVAWHTVVKQAFESQGKRVPGLGDFVVTGGEYQLIG